MANTANSSTTKRTPAKKATTSDAKKIDDKISYKELEKRYLELLTSNQESQSSNQTKDITNNGTDIDLNEQVNVRSCCDGELIYIATVGDVGFTVRWSEFGTTNIMSIKQLQDMRNTQRRFFENNWITIESPKRKKILEYLYVDQYYSKIGTFDDIDNTFVKFNSDPSLVEDFVSNISDGLKEVFARRAYSLIQEGKLTNYNAIKTLERELGYEFDD